MKLTVLSSSEKWILKLYYITESGGAHLHSTSNINTLWLDVLVTEAVQHSALFLSFHKGTKPLETQQPVRDAPWESETHDDHKKCMQKSSQRFSDEKNWINGFYVIKYLKQLSLCFNTVLASVGIVCFLKHNWPNCWINKAKRTVWRMKYIFSALQKSIPTSKRKEIPGSVKKTCPQKKKTVVKSNFLQTGRLYNRRREAKVMERKGHTIINYNINCNFLSNNASNKWCK